VMSSTARCKPLRLPVSPAYPSSPVPKPAEQPEPPGVNWTIRGPSLGCTSKSFLKPSLSDIEGDGSIHVRNRERDQFQPHLHRCRASLDLFSCSRSFHTGPPTSAHGRVAYPLGTRAAWRQRAKSDPRHFAACRHAGDRNCCPLRSGSADISARRVWRRVGHLLHGRS
jgi:hypothetical protein